MRVNPTISLCMIVKNEEDQLPNCLKSVVELVDEIIIVDTGSTDLTVEKAISFGAKVYHFPWNNNFSAARNFSLTKATGDWLLILDADEVLESNIDDRLTRLVQDEEAEAYLFQINSYFGGHTETDILVDARISLFRNNEKYRFTGSIHEEISSSIQECTTANQIKNSDIKIFHYGYTDQIVAEKNKTARNKEIIQRELAAVNGEDSFLCYALATEHLQEENYAAAKQLLSSVIEKWDYNHPNYSDAIYKLALCHKELKEYQQSRELLTMAIKVFPDYTDLHFLFGTIELELNELPQAVKSFMQCLHLGDPQDSYYTLAGVGSYRAWFALGYIYERQGKIQQALAAYLKTLTIKPQFPGGLQKLLECGLQNLTTEEFSNYIKQNFAVNQPPTYQAISQTLFSLNRLDFFFLLSLNTELFTEHEENYLIFSKICEALPTKLSW